MLFRPQCVNTLRLRRNGQHFADDIFKCIFFIETIWMSIKIWLKFVPKGPIYNIPALVQIMAWRRPGDKPLSEPMMVNLPTHICVTRPRWVKNIFKNNTFHWWDNIIYCGQNVRVVCKKWKVCIQPAYLLIGEVTPAPTDQSQETWSFRVASCTQWLLPCTRAIPDRDHSWWPPEPNDCDPGQWPLLIGIIQGGLLDPMIATSGGINSRLVGD